MTEIGGSEHARQVDRDEEQRALRRDFRENAPGEPVCDAPDEAALRVLPQSVEQHEAQSSRPAAGRGLAMTMPSSSHTRKVTAVLPSTDGMLARSLTSSSRTRSALPRRRAGSCSPATGARSTVTTSRTKKTTPSSP